MLIRLLALTTLLLLALALPAVAAPYAQSPGYAPSDRDGRQDSRRHLRQLRKDLGLTDEQTRQIRAIISDRRNQLASLRERCHADRTTMHAAFRRGDLGEEELRQTAHRQADCRVDGLLQRRSARERISTLLTPEQHVRWEEKRERFPGQGNHRQWGRQNF